MSKNCLKNYIKSRILNYQETSRRFIKKIILTIYQTIITVKFAGTFYG